MASASSHSLPMGEGDTVGKKTPSPQRVRVVAAVAEVEVVETPPTPPKNSNRRGSPPSTAPEHVETTQVTPANDNGANFKPIVPRLNIPLSPEIISDVETLDEEAVMTHKWPSTIPSPDGVITIESPRSQPGNARMGTMEGLLGIHSPSTNAEGVQIAKSAPTSPELRHCLSPSPPPSAALSDDGAPIKSILKHSKKKGVSWDNKVVSRRSSSVEDLSTLRCGTLANPSSSSSSTRTRKSMVTHERSLRRKSLRAKTSAVTAISSGGGGVNAKFSNLLPPDATLPPGCGGGGGSQVILRRASSAVHSGTGVSGGSRTVRRKSQMPSSERLVRGYVNGRPVLHHTQSQPSYHRPTSPLSVPSPPLARRNTARQSMLMQRSPSSMERRGRFSIQTFRHSATVQSPRVECQRELLIRGSGEGKGSSKGSVNSVGSIVEGDSDRPATISDSSNLTADDYEYLGDNLRSVRRKVSKAGRKLSAVHAVASPPTSRRSRFVSMAPKSTPSSKLPELCPRDGATFAVTTTETKDTSVDNLEDASSDGWVQRGATRSDVIVEEDESEDEESQSPADDDEGAHGMPHDVDMEDMGHDLDEESDDDEDDEDDEDDDDDDDEYPHTYRRESSMESIGLVVERELFDWSGQMPYVNSVDPHEIKAWFYCPPEFEKFAHIGVLMLLDQLLYFLTFFPIAVFMALWTMFRSHVLRADVPIFSKHKATVLEGALVLLGIFLLASIDHKHVREIVREQSVFRLYVIFQFFEVMENITKEFGRKIIGSLNGAVSHEQPCTAIFLFSVVYVLLHSIVLYFQVTALMVAMEGGAEVLTTIVTVQLSELKAGVMKLLGIDELFKLCLRDAIDRFKWICFLAIIFGIHYGEQPGMEFLHRFAWGCVAVYGVDIAIDWVKHSSIAMANDLESDIYTEFTSTLCIDLVTVPKIGLGDSQFHIIVEKRFGHIPLAHVVVVLGAYFDCIFSHPTSPLVLGSAIYAFLCIVKLIIRVSLRSLAKQSVEDNTPSDALDDGEDARAVHSPSLVSRRKSFAFKDILKYEFKQMVGTKHSKIE